MGQSPILYGRKCDYVYNQKINMTQKVFDGMN